MLQSIDYEDNIVLMATNTEDGKWEINHYGITLFLASYKKGIWTGRTNMVKRIYHCKVESHLINIWEEGWKDWPR